MNDYYYIKCLDLYICPYIISLIKIINKFFLIFFFIIPYLLMKMMIWIQAVKAILILA